MSTINEKRAEQTAEKTKMTDAEVKKLGKLFKDAKLPVVLKDKDFTLGAGELDIRELSEENYRQMMFRLKCQEVVYLKSLHEDAVDLMKLLMVVGKKLGIDDFAKELDVLQEDLEKAN